MLINSGITIYQGSTPLIRAYQGTTIVWEKQQPIVDIPLLYLANGEDSTSGSTRSVYFDTEVIANLNTKIEVKCGFMPFIIPSGSGKINTFLGIHDGIHQEGNAFFMNIGWDVDIFSFEANVKGYGGGSSEKYADPYNANIIETWIDKEQYPHAHIKVNGVEGEPSYSAVHTNGDYITSLGIFSKKASDGYWDMEDSWGGTKIYYLKIWDGNTLIRDYIPVLHEGVPCFKDNVSGTYIYNLGTDTPSYQIL